MSVQETKRFLKAVAADPALADKASTVLKDKTPAEGRQALSQLAGETGYDLTPADLLELCHRVAEGLPLSEEDLSSVAGGGSFVVALPEGMQAASNNLAQLGQQLQQSNPNLASTTFAQPVAIDDISIGIAQLFGSYGQEYQSLNSQVAAFQQQFAALLKP